MKKVFFYKLKNKMDVIFEKISNVNIVSIFFVIKVGSGNEEKGKEGISHFLEHIIFKGSKNFSAKDITEKIESLGGSINGYTSLDETAFYITIPKRNWKQGFYILQDMVFNPKFSESDFENERKVIIEELKGGKDNPFKLLIDETFSSIFKKHPYKNPVIGFQESIKSLLLNDLKEFYKKYYVPENILLTVVGNLKEEDIKNEIFNLEKISHNQSIKLIRKNIQEPEQKKLQLRIVNSEVNQFYLNLVFKIKIKEPKDLISVQLLSLILGEFEHSFLRDRLKNKMQLVTDIGSFIFFTKDYLIFNIHSQFPKNISPKKVIKAVLKELANFNNEVILPDQLLKAKINFKTEKIFMRESVSGEAKNIIFYHLLTGSYKNEEKFYKTADKINEKDIKKVFKKFFNLNNGNIILLAPEQYKESLKIKDFISSKATPKKIREKLELITLDNGIKIVYKKIDRLPLISFKVATLGGLKYEDKDKNGIANFMTKTWLRGSKNYFYKEIENRFDFFSGFIDTFSGRNSSGIHGVVLDEFFEPAFDIVFDILNNPLFLESEIENVRKEISEKIIAEKDDIFTEAIRFFYKTLFKNHYYGLTIKGEIDSIKRIKRNDIVNFYKKIVKSQNIVIGITGKIGSNHIDFICNSLMKIKNSDFNPGIEKLDIFNKYNFQRKKINKNQSYITTGFLAPSVEHDDIINLKIIKSIVGNHSGRLFNYLREDAGLCYSTFAFMMNGLEASAFGIFVSTSSENEDIVIEKLKKSILTLKEEGITDEEISKAKNSIKGSIDNYNQKFLNVNTSNVFNILYGLGKNYNKEFLKKLNKIKKQNLMETIEKYFNPEKFTFAVISSKE